MKVKSIESIRAQLWCDVFKGADFGLYGSDADMALEEFDKRFRGGLEAEYSKYTCLHEWGEGYDEFGDWANICTKCNLVKYK